MCMCPASERYRVSYHPCMIESWHAYCNISYTYIGDPDLETIQILCALLKGSESFIVSYGIALGGDAGKD